MFCYCEMAGSGECLEVNFLNIVTIIQSDRNSVDNVREFRNIFPP